jgi:hypothetical protein
MLWGKLRAPVVNFTFVIAALCVFCASGSAQAGLDFEGKAVDPLRVNDGKITVLIFVREDCPVSSRYAPVLQEIASRYTENAKFWLVFPDKSETAAAMRNYVSQYGYTFPTLRDPAHSLTKLSRVQITPEVAVFDRGHHLVYDGRIDDWYISLGSARPAPTTHELESALQAAVSGKKVTESEVRGVGCYISDLD